MGIDTLDHAKSFADNCGFNKRIFECECVGVCDKDNVGGFYKAYVSRLPDGTLFAHGVKLLSEIKPDIRLGAGAEFSLTTSDGKVRWANCTLVQYDEGCFCVINKDSMNRICDKMRLVNTNGYTELSALEEVAKKSGYNVVMKESN